MPDQAHRTAAAGGASPEVERVFREVYGQAVATLVRVFGDITLAEDAVQDAFLVAGGRWPEEGTPPNPAGWIITTARNRATDVVRRAGRGRELHVEAQAMAMDSTAHHEDSEGCGPVDDDQLRLIFTCCHPALAPEHRVALTLRLLGGLSVAEVARSFLVTETAMDKRLVRAKYKIKAANIPYRIPTEADLPARLQSVLAVIYLIYNTGLDDRARASLRDDAFRLVRSLVNLMPDQTEVQGLLALMLLSEARVPARSSDAVVLLRDQDRSLWNRGMIDEGHDIVRACIRTNRPGPYQVQAAIQAVHAYASTFEATDWPQIVTLYDQLLVHMPTPMVALNRAIAIAEVHGPDRALELLDGIAADLENYHLLHATRGEMLSRLGRLHEAREAFELAATSAPTDLERAFINGRIEEVTL